MNTTPEMGATDHEPSTPPLPPPLPELKPTVEKGDDHHFHSTINLISELEMESKMDNEKDEESSSFSASYSSSDSESGFFQIGPLELAYPPPSPTTAVNVNMDGNVKIRNPNSEKSSGSGTERRSPVVQSMARDPNRIPSSIFARSPMTPMEWSVASNESLFSIHMGNTSFSKDQMFLTGRSGELRGITSGTIEYPLPWISPDLRSVAVEAGGGKREMGDLVVEMDEAAAASVNAEAMKEVMRAAAEGKESEKKVMLGRSISRHSDGSTASFAFPILTGDGRIGSIKVNFEHHKDNQPNPQIKQSKTFSDKAPMAMMRSHLPAHSQSPTSVQSKWFPCFSRFKHRFCCGY